MLDTDQFSSSSSMKTYSAGDLGEKGIVPAAAYIFTGMKSGAPLTDNNGSRIDKLTAVTLDAEPLRIGIATVL